MIYLVGTNHKLQHNGFGGADEILRKNFAYYLEGIIKEYGVTLIAEEFNEEALQKSKATFSTVKYVADKLKIKHLFCDPNTEERKIIGMPSDGEIRKTLGFKPYLNHDEVKILDAEKRKYFTIRENFWFDKIEKYLNKAMIFICGADHIRSFKTLLIDKGYRPIVLIEDWEK